MQIAQWGWCYNVLYLCSALVVFKIFKHIAPSQLLIRQPLASHFFVLATSKHVYCHCLINHSSDPHFDFAEYENTKFWEKPIMWFQACTNPHCKGCSNPDLDETLPCSHFFLLAQRNHWFLGLANVLFGPVKHGSSCGAAIVAASTPKVWPKMLKSTGFSNKRNPFVDSKRNSYHHDYIIVS